MATEGVWCLVANVGAEPFGRATSSGTKHFSAGTKVYCMPPLWGDGYEQIKVVARHRGSQNWVVMVLPSARLTQWRVKLIFHPAVIRRLERHWTKESAEGMLRSLVTEPVRVGGVNDARQRGRQIGAALKWLADDATAHGLEMQALTDLEEFDEKRWQAEPDGPPSIQVLRDRFEELGATVEPETLARILRRRARFRASG